MEETGKDEKGVSGESPCPDTGMQVCPNCLGRGKVMGFAAPDRAKADPGGWKALPCPVCQGSGQCPAHAPAGDTSA